MVAYSRGTFGYIRHENLRHTVLPVTSHLCQMTKYVCIQYFFVKKKQLYKYPRQKYLSPTQHEKTKLRCVFSDCAVTIVCWLCEDASLSQLHVDRPSLRCDKFSATKSRTSRSKMFKDIYLTGDHLGKDVIGRGGSDKCRVYVGQYGLKLCRIVDMPCYNEREASTYNIHGTETKI